MSEALYRRLWNETMQRHRSSKPGELLQRMLATVPEVPTTASAPKPRICPQCTAPTATHGAICSRCQRDADDAALEADGYDIVDWRYVIDLEGHRVLRSVALSRLAGRAA